MAIDTARQVSAVALGFGSEMRPEDAIARDERSAWQRARDRLACALIKEEWRPAADLDVGIWGPLVGRAEADRCLLDAVERGALYLDPAPQSARGRSFLARLLGTAR